MTLGAEFRVCFTDNFHSIASKMWPLLQFDIQPQSVTVQPLPCFNNISRQLVLISGIRPVKDVMFALECWNNYMNNYPNESTQFLIIGPIIDHEYAQRVFQVW